MSLENQKVLVEFPHGWTVYSEDGDAFVGVMHDEHEDDPIDFLSVSIPEGTDAPRRTIFADVVDRFLHAEVVYTTKINAFAVDLGDYNVTDDESPVRAVYAENSDTSGNLYVATADTFEQLIENLENYNK